MPHLLDQGRSLVYIYYVYNSGAAKMKNFKLSAMRLTAASVVLLLVSSCGGGASDTASDTTDVSNVSALKMNSKVSIIDAKASSSSANVSSLTFDSSSFAASMTSAAVDSFSSTSDYVLDETFIYVQDDTTEALDNVNKILCYFDQIQSDKMLNKGNYKAQVNETQCDQNKGSASDSAGSGGGADKSGGGNVTYSYWVVNAARASNTAVQVVKAWIAPDMDAATSEQEFIEAKLTITEGRSASNPVGIFRMDFIGFAVDSQGNATTTEMMKGFMSTEFNAAGKVVLKYHNSLTRPGMDPFEEGITVVRNSDGTEGVGSTAGMQWDSYPPTPITYDFAYNTDHFYRKDNNNATACMDRKDFNETTWRYGMYDSSGKRVDINSGFPISSEGSGEKYHGWIGYWGLWMPDEAGIVDGSSVTKESFVEGEVGETYTVAQVGGKMERHSKKTLTMAEIKNIPVSWYDDNSGNEYQVMWDGTNLVKAATRNNESDWRWVPLTPQQTLTFTAGTYGFFFYSDSLGGDGQIKFDNWDDITSVSGANIVPTVSASSTVIFHVRDIIYPSDATVPANLVCYDNCPDPAKLGDANYFFSTDWNNPTEQKYTFASGMLKSNGTSVVMATETDANPHGIWSGALFENSAANLAKLECPWDTSQMCPWQAWDVLDSYYTWSTGPHDWNKLTTLKRSGEYLKFDAPMQVTYTHNAGDYADTVFYLDYEGFGSLQGIPEMCVDTTTGVEKDCWSVTDDEHNSGNIRWMRKFVIPNGSTAASTGTTPTEYVIKSLEMEQSMKKVDDSVCSVGGLSLTSQSLPSLSEWVSPNLAAMPILTGPPAVIGGVVHSE